MSHQTCMSQPHKHNVLKTSINQNKSKSKSCQARTCSNTKTSPHKVKRLKTKKERNKIRSSEKNESHAFSQSSKKSQEHRGCHQSHSVICGRKAKPFAKPFVSQKPSFITEGRLTSIRGLFSHEVKSIDVERLVSDHIKNEKQNKDKRKLQTMRFTSPPPPPPEPDSDQDYFLDEEPQQESENNTLPCVRTQKNSEKELNRKYPNAIQTNKEVTHNSAHKRKNDRSASSREEETCNKSRLSSFKGGLQSSSENKLQHQLCSTPVNDKNYSDFSEIVSPIPHIQNSKQNIEAPQNKSGSSLLDPGTGMWKVDDKELRQISVSVREAMKKLTARFSQTVDDHVPRRSMLTECREVLLQALERTHGFHLQDNLHKLHLFLNGKTHKESSFFNFSHADGKGERKHCKNVDVWTEDFMQPKEIWQDWDRDAYMTNHGEQPMKMFSPQVPRKQPIQIDTELFDQSGTWSSEDFFRTLHYPSTGFFQQDQHVFPISNAPTWAGNESISQHLLGGSHRNRDKKADTDPMPYLYHKYQNKEQKTEEAYLGESSFWSNQLQFRGVREENPFSESRPSERFQNNPFFHFSHPSNSQQGSDWIDMTSHVKSSTDRALYFF